MRSITFAGLAALATIALGSTQASACYSCGYRGYGYYPPPAYGYYYAPPVYAYSYDAPPAYAYYTRRPYAYVPPPAYGYYYTRVNIFRGPRWNYSAAYYNSPVAYGYYRRPRVYGYGYFAGPRAYGGHSRGYVGGLRIRAWRRW